MPKIKRPVVDLRATKMTALIGGAAQLDGEAEYLLVVVRGTWKSNRLGGQEMMSNNLILYPDTTLSTTARDQPTHN